MADFVLELSTSWLLLQRAVWNKFYKCYAYKSYGPNDNFDLETSHVLPNSKFYLAKLL
jgi:hypothetical protein